MIDRFFFKGKKVTVFGLGMSGGGVGTVEFLVRAGATDIRVTDAKNAHELAESVAKIEHFSSVRLFLGEHRKEDFTEVDMVIKNPRIPWTNEYIQLAREANVPVEMDSSIFFALCDKPILGVTGTKGKSTTASLINAVLSGGGYNSRLIGNIGQPVLSYMEGSSKDDFFVYELSAHQLYGLTKSPHISVLTNLYPEHLDYYSDFNEYILAKSNIAIHQSENDFFIYNSQNAECRDIAAKCPAKKFAFNESTWRPSCDASEFSIFDLL